MARNTPQGTGLRLRKNSSAYLKPVPDAVEGITEGTAAADVPINMPRMPKSVQDDEDLRELWEDIVPELFEFGMVSRIDKTSLELMIRHFYAARVASEDLNLGEPTVWDEHHGRPMKNPSEVVFRSQSMAFMAYAKEMGMTFASRTRIPSQQQKATADEGNPFAATG